MNWYNNAAVRNLLIVIGVASLLVLSGVKYAGARNRLLAERTAVEAQWAEVATAMQRRADTIFNLAYPMKGVSSDTGEPRRRPPMPAQTPPALAPDSSALR